MEFDIEVKLAVYRHFAETGHAPHVRTIAERLGVDEGAIRRSFGALRAARVLFLEPDDVTIRMAPPFSGVPTAHVVRVREQSYYANCAWDALGIPAALHAPANVQSRCAQTGELLDLDVGLDGPGPSPWIFHSLVPAARWWQDLVFT
jgi:alkylmercury lyase-like protein